ncbi:MAG TPA: hypothetical protein VE007_04275 [Thermoanaerobaculia bacterium]|nr:hypothetical protein [Thermoanaerobaculia bacterium]
MREEVLEAGEREARVSRSGPADAALWFGIVVPPLAWAANELLGLVLTDWVCDTGRRWPLHLITAVAFLTAASAGWISWQAGVPLEGEPDDSRIAKRRRFMRTLAMLLTGFFLLVILAGAVPGAVHRPCD